MADGGHLAENVLHFARLLRQAGLPVGTDRPLLALRALELAGIDSRDDLRAVLEACLIDRFAHRPLFEQAFLAFWRVPGDWDAPGPGSRPANARARSKSLERPAAARRVAQALGSGHRALVPIPESEAARVAEEVRPSASDRERLRRVDFETMTAAEWNAAARAAAALAPLLRPASSRRQGPAASGPKIDARRLLREAARRGGDVATLPRRRRLTALEPIVAIVDISGSMSRYSRMFLHFLHAWVNCGRRASASGRRTAVFVFGTRLTAITRALRARDPDDALARVTRCVPDFSGGTRIGACLREFNRVWAKRLPLAQATVLLVTDGLETSDIERLEHEAARLERSCRRILWLNPLLRYEGFEPQARGVRALLPHAAELLPIHNLDSLERLADILADAGADTGEIRRWR